MRASGQLLRRTLMILIFLAVAVACAIMYDTGLYHNIEFHPIPQHEPQVPAPEAH